MGLFNLFQKHTVEKFVETIKDDCLDLYTVTCRDQLTPKTIYLYTNRGSQEPDRRLSVDSFMVSPKTYSGTSLTKILHQLEQYRIRLIKTDTLNWYGNVESILNLPANQFIDIPIQNIVIQGENCIGFFVDNKSNTARSYEFISIGLMMERLRVHNNTASTGTWSQYKLEKVRCGECGIIITEENYGGTPMFGVSRCSMCYHEKSIFSKNNFSNGESSYIYISIEYKNKTWVSNFTETVSHGYGGGYTCIIPDEYIVNGQINEHLVIDMYRL